jgi:tRNA 2-thiouridine synthesizing protein A
MEFNQECDASGLLCPLPIIRTKKALAGMGSGEVLRVVATDPGLVRDMPTLTRKTGDTLLQQEREGPAFVFYLRKT